MIETLAVVALSVLLAVSPGGSDAARIEGFDDGQVVLKSFPGQDVHPDSWALDSLRTAHGTAYSLRLFGNTWKLESISPVRVDTGSVWQVSAYVESLGEIQGFGLADSAHVLFYSLAGSERVNPDTWVTVYQGAFPAKQWNDLRLPVADDWLARFGYLPTITGLIFINDRDTDPRASVWFDEVIDITADLPVSPLVDIWHSVGRPFGGRGGAESVAVQFHSSIYDPDGRDHEYCWRFGDGAASADSNPLHVYRLKDNHEYNVLLEVEDSTGLWGRASCLVSVDPGPTTFPVRLNFVGDIMLARRYEDPGGIIDTLGVEGIFEPTKPFLGDVADITVANLESPLTAQGTRHPTKPIVFRGRPSNIAGLVYAGIDAVSLANNHVVDYGLEGLREIQESLSVNRIGFSGAGANSYEAYQPLFVQRDGVSFAFLRFSDRTAQYDNYQPYLNAGWDKPGFAEETWFEIARRVEAVRPDADRIVVELHSGVEYSPTPENVDGEDEFYTPFARVPTDSVRAVRRFAIDQGADVVIGHHPHVVQGFEVHGGRLIAHSLGDFTFDLNYPETYPSVILNASVDEAGFRDFTVTPVYIDDYIPVRAHGELGDCILDYLARRSRELGAYVVVDRDSVLGRIALDTQALTSTKNPGSADLELSPEGNYSVSAPTRLPGLGSLSSVVSVTPARTWQYRVGREMVWWGNCEDEGSTLWLLSQPGEGYDTIAHRGRRSLLQTRAESSAALVTNFEERIPCYSDSASYSLHGWIRADNAESAGIAAKFYSSRPSGSVIGTADLGTTVNGTAGWTFFHREFTPVLGTRYLDVWLRSRGPESGRGSVWYDDVGIVEWEGWQTLNGPAPIVHPNDHQWVQVRTVTPTTGATLSYEETDFGPQTGIGGGLVAAPGFRLFRPFPNPGRGGSQIRYSLTRPGRVTLKVYNPLGQEVRTLISGPEPAGLRSTRWDGRDNSGQTVSAGTYFCRLESGGASRTGEVVLLR